MAEFYNSDLYVPAEDYKKIMSTMVYDKIDNKSYTIRDYCKKTHLDEQLVSVVLHNNQHYESASLLRTLMKSNRVASIRLGDMVEYNLSLGNEIKALAKRQEALEETKKILNKESIVIDSSEVEKLKEANEKLSKKLEEKDVYFQKIMDEKDKEAKENSSFLLDRISKLLKENKKLEKSRSNILEKEKKISEREKLLRDNEEEFKKEVKRFTDIVLQFKNG